ELNGVDNYNNNNLIFQQQNESQHPQQQQIQTPTRPSSSSNYCKKEECSGDELPPNEELIGAPVHEIRCGLLIGKLHMIRFTCPGIHRKCVEFEGKLISPRQFTIKAEKDKQKDWKGSIRLGKHNLRTLMEMKTLDFYEHEINCSLKCQSRNYIKNRKAEGNGNNEMNINSDNNSERFSEMCEINDIKSISSSACSSATSTRKSNGIEKLLAAAALSQQLQQRTPLKHNEQPAAVTNISNIRKSMEENASMFWSQMRNMGLLEDMLKTLSDTLERLKQIYLTGGNAVSEEFAAQRLSGVAIALDLCSLFGEKIHSRYIQATLESTIISKELLELQRKQDEQKRKLENAKRKSQVFDQILKNGNGTATALNKNIINSTSLRGTNHSSSTNENGTPEIKKIHLNI
uniref:SAND domain-containing protein n=1 Tax=Meloidogyne javanica TaxID=6303 RepID=A0A915LPT0_MELJA